MDRNSLLDYQAPPNAYFRKKSKDCFAEYSTNRRFRRIVESGNFVFVDEHLVNTENGQSPRSSLEDLLTGAIDST